jgi:hypothetical protein
MPEDMAVLIARAVEKAVQPFQECISSLEDTITLLRKKTAALEATQATLSDNQFIQLKLTNDLREAARRLLSLPYRLQHHRARKQKTG